MLVFRTKQRQDTPCLWAALIYRCLDCLSGLVLSMTTLLPAVSAASRVDTHFCQEPNVSLFTWWYPSGARYVDAKKVFPEPGYPTRTTTCNNIQHSNVQIQNPTCCQTGTLQNTKHWFTHSLSPFNGGMRQCCPIIFTSFPPKSKNTDPQWVLISENAPAATERGDLQGHMLCRTVGQGTLKPKKPGWIRSLH